MKLDQDVFKTLYLGFLHGQAQGHDTYSVRINQEFFPEIVVNMIPQEVPLECAMIVMHKEKIRLAFFRDKDKIVFSESSPEVREFFFFFYESDGSGALQYNDNYYCFDSKADIEQKDSITILSAYENECIRFSCNNGQAYVDKNLRISVRECFDFFVKKSGIEVEAYKLAPRPSQPIVEKAVESADIPVILNRKDSTAYGNNCTN